MRERNLTKSKKTKSNNTKSNNTKMQKMKNNKKDDDDDPELAESLVDGAISDNCSVQWLRTLKSAMKHAQAATDEDDSALVQLQECLRKMIETPGTYFQGTDLLLRHYVSYAKDYMSSVTTSPASARVTDMKSWTEASLPDVG